MLPKMDPIEVNSDPTEAAFALYAPLQHVFAELSNSRQEIRSSKCREARIRRSLQQLVDCRYEKFTRTLARNYFSWIVKPLNHQARFQMREAGVLRSLGFLKQALFGPRLCGRGDTFSMHEIRMDQIRYRVAEAERPTQIDFYFKQWKETTVPYGGETIREADFPVGEDWMLINRQQCDAQHNFFQALYALAARRHDNGWETS